MVAIREPLGYDSYSPENPHTEMLANSLASALAVAGWVGATH
jgi:hypothetical protein